MKKRLLAILLVIALAVSLLPVGAMADNWSYYGHGNGTDNGNEYDASSTTDQKVSNGGEKGITINKTLTGNDTDGYEISLEAYVTGTISAPTSQPLDIVLVLDQSGSMGDDFGNTTRQAAMKQAVNSFITSVEQNSGENHRIAIVTFDDSTHLLNGGWTQVTSEGAAALKSSVSRLTDNPSGATRVDEGMDRAQILMTAPHRDAQKVVIVFTDGVPTTSSMYSNEVADDAVASAKRLKDGGATIYTIGIFGGADPTQMYGTDGASGTPGEVGYEWSAERVLFWGDVSEAEVGAANRFLNLLSSNYPDATDDGLYHDNEYWVLYEEESFEITGNFNRDPNGNYYLTASNADQLKNVFEEIAGEIVPGIQAGADSVLTDTLTGYVDFDLPAGAGSVASWKVMQASGDGAEPDWTEDTDYNGVTVDIDEQTKTITAKGFDYSAGDNVVTRGDNGQWQGHKLVVTFPIEINKDCTTWGASGYYPTNETGATNSAGVKLADGTYIDELDDSPKIYVETYKVDYEFVSADGSELPSGLPTLPNDKHYLPGSNVTNEGQDSYNSITTTDGTWTFKGWDKPSVDSISENTTFTGTWEFESKQQSNFVNVKVFLDGVDVTADYDDYLTGLTATGTTAGTGVEYDATAQVVKITYTHEEIDAADVKFGVASGYVLQGATGTFVFGESGCKDPVQTNGTWTIDNVDGSSTLNVYLNTAYNVVYMVPEGTEGDFTDDKTYITEAEVTETSKPAFDGITAESSADDRNEGKTGSWKNDGLKTTITVKDLPDNTTEAQYTGWWLNDSDCKGEPDYKGGDTVIVAEAALTDSTTITFYANSSKIYPAGYFVLVPGNIPEDFRPGGDWDSDAYLPYETETTESGDTVDVTTGYIGYITEKGKKAVDDLTGDKNGTKRLEISNNDYLIVPTDFGETVQDYLDDGYKIVWYQINNTGLSTNWPDPGDDFNDTGNGYHVDGYIKGMDIEVRYYANDETQNYHSHKTTSGAEYKVLGNNGSGEDQNFTREGYTFTGWNTQPDGTGEDYDANETITLMTSLVLYAQWEKDENDDTIPDKYQVFVNFESADEAKGAVTGDGTTQVFTLKDDEGNFVNSGDVTPTLDNVTTAPGTGYVFDHWTKDEGTGAVTPTDTLENVTGGTTITFYANFAEDSDGSGIPDKYEVTVTYEIEDTGSWVNPNGENYVKESNTFVYDNIALKEFDEAKQQWVNTDPTPTLGENAPIPSGKDAAGNTDTGTWYKGEADAGITDATKITENVTYTLKFTAEPGLEVTKTAAETVNVGDTIVYTVTVENTGNVALSNVVVTDTMFGDKVTSITVDGTETDITDDGYTIDALPVGATVTITYSYTATEADAANEDGVTNTATAKAGEDGPEDTAKTETVVTNYTVSIAPADIVAYTGGKAYGAIVGEDGKESDVTASGLPRPGYHIELSADVVNWFTEHGVASTDPDEAAQDLSQYITFTYDDGNGTIREWTLTYRGIHDIDEITGEPTRYVYTLNATGNAPDVRLQYKDGDEYVFTDDFDMDENTVKAEYEMSIYPGDLNQNLIKAVIKVGEESIEATTKVGTGKLTVLSTTNVEYTNPLINPETGKISAAVPAGEDVTFTVNDSQVELDDDQVSLLVDSVSDSAEFNAQLEEHAANAAGMEGAATESFYLDLVHAENGNVQAGLNGTLTINWPMPSDANPDGDFKIVHYIAMDRNATFTVDELTANDYHANTAVTKNDDGTLSFDVKSFSPFVLVYEAKETAVTVDKSASDHRPEVGDRVKYTLVVENTGNTTTDITVRDTLWKAGTVIILDDADHTRVELTGNSHTFLDVPANATITITYYYTPTWRDVGRLVNEATVTAGEVTDSDTVTVIVDDGWTPNIPDDDDEDVEPDVEYTPNWLNTDDHFAYIVGYEDGSVRPTANITRAEVATIFFRLLTDEARAEFWSSENDFTDVASDAWYNNAVSTLSGMGILGGYEDGSFRPNASITRAEFVAIATRFFDYSARYEGGFTDVSYGDWYADCVQASADMGLVNGYEDGSFRPNASITRAEACAIVNRVLHRIPHEDHLLSESVMNVWPDNPKSAWYYADMQEATNSHDYDWTRESGSVVEDWTDKLPERDWSALETEWANAYSK